jgi:DNA polymerase V
MEKDRVTKTKSYIAVIDCNNFFVSCERVFRPDLAKKPVIVLSSNDGCVVARSQEVKDMAIPMGVPVFQIKDIIKDKGITLFSSNFTLYRDFSRRVFAIVRATFTHFEQYSIDEGFMYLGDIEEEEAVKQAIALKQKIYKYTGIPVSIGIGHTKTQAKYASTKAKRSEAGVFVCHEVWWQENAHLVSLGDIWGVGRQLRERYRRHGINTVEDLFSTPLQSLQTIGGVVSLRLLKELQSEVFYPVEPSAKIPQSIISSRSFGTTTTKKAVLLAALTHHLHSVISDLEEQKLVASQLTIYIEEKRTKDGKKYQTIPISLNFPTRNTSILLRLVLAAVDTHYKASLYKKVGVMASGLLPEHYVQHTLFDVAIVDEVETKKNNPAVAHTLMYELQKKYSTKVVTIGTNNTRDEWKSRQELCSPTYTTCWTKLRLVRAEA